MINYTIKRIFELSNLLNKVCNKNEKLLCFFENSSFWFEFIYGTAGSILFLAFVGSASKLKESFIELTDVQVLQNTFDCLEISINCLSIQYGCLIKPTQMLFLKE
ncbi:hypothetical protein BpHYR1_034966 [Brachionus plicatilis]|uniref:Uncharacterized protein n=1 Tax=Brachionus plicatilis TaxID=10195 RepID=A0A3M7S4E5_BRAPC|nr:hypothetical protein BpHYR1_034966 [Brachionus plicatilis]